MIKILVACEESQTVCKAFREHGFEAYSCDIQDCSGGHSEWHIKGDCLQQLDKGWTMMIGHPPCTYLTLSGNKWFYHPDDTHLPFPLRRPHPKYPNRQKDRELAIDFFMKLMRASIPHIAIENPIGIMNTEYRKPDQIIQPYQFGHEIQKSTCLWLMGLPKLKPTEIVNKGEMHITPSGKVIPKWYSNCGNRKINRSKTFIGIANAMVDQWGEHLKSIYGK
jgi:hypothetical protein